MRLIGFLVNPIAGMGGRVGLKGTDGVVEEARELGATPEAPERAKRALRALISTDMEVQLLTWGGSMGASEAEAVNIPHEVVGHPSNSTTSAADTRVAVQSFVEYDVDLLLFAGGDGTAVDIATTLQSIHSSIPILGIPAGVKIYSSVFAHTPEAAGRIAGTFERTESREVADIDEDAYRQGEVRSRVHGVVSVPVGEEVQAGKQLGGGSIDAVVAGMIESMDPETTYFLGPGGTLQEIKQAIGVDGTPLGVDIVQNGELLRSDATESDLLTYIDNPTTIVVSPIGGQGFIFGRGNQQFSPRVIRGSELEIVATREKLDGVGVLRVDTGDPNLDDELRGWTKVRVGRVERRMMQIV